MARGTIRLDGHEDLRRLEKMFAKSQKELRKSIVRALNRTAQGVMTDIISGVRNEIGLNVKVRDVRRLMTLTRAWEMRLKSSVRLKGKASIPLYSFSPRPSVETRGKAWQASRKTKGVSVLVLKGNGRKMVEGTFIARRPEGRLGVFKRVGRERYPLRELYGPDVLTYMRVGGRLHDRILDKTRDRLRKNIAAEVGYAMHRGFA